MDVLTEMADGLYYDCQIREGKRPATLRDIAWEKKYVNVNYPNKREDQH